MKNSDERIRFEEWCIKRRIVPVFGTVTDEMANNIVCMMYYLEEQDPEEEIVFWINSPGGAVSAGLMIFDAINTVKCDVRTVCMGMAASMGAFLLGAGTRGKRQSMPNGEIMIHQPLGGAQGQVSDLMIQMKHAENTRKTLNEYLSVFTDKPLAQIEKDTDRDYYMSAKEALEYGLIDGIIESGVKAGKRGDREKRGKK